MPVDPRFTTRSFRDGDEVAILELFNRSFPHAPRSLAHFDWKYRRNPFGSRRISLTFDADGRLAGHYAGYSVPFRHGSRDVVAHQIGDTMTDPAIRHIGRGPTSILGRTALHFYANFCDGEVAFNYGFNVANIQKFSLRFLRSDRVEPVTYRVAPRPERITKRERWLRGYRLEEVRRTTPEWDDLFARVSGAYEFLVRRDARYVQWRYLDCPDVPYVVVAIRKLRRLVGWIVFRVTQNRFLLGDLLIHPAFPDALEVALRHVVPSHPVETIETWLPPRPQWLDLALRELGFETRPEPQDLSVMCVPFGWPDATARMRRSLFYTWGDSDLF
jgi:Acetyltransferase (GNAT) domain